MKNQTIFLLTAAVCGVQSIVAIYLISRSRTFWRFALLVGSVVMARYSWTWFKYRPHSTTEEQRQKFVLQILLSASGVGLLVVVGLVGPIFLSLLHSSKTTNNKQKQDNEQQTLKQAIINWNNALENNDDLKLNDYLGDLEILDNNNQVVKSVNFLALCLSVAEEKNNIKKIFGEKYKPADSDEAEEAHIHKQLFDIVSSEDPYNYDMTSVKHNDQLKQIVQGFRARTRESQFLIGWMFDLAVFKLPIVKVEDIQYTFGHIITALAKNQKLTEATHEMMMLNKITSNTSIEEAKKILNSFITTQATRLSGIGLGRRTVLLNWFVLNHVPWEIDDGFISKRLENLVAEFTMSK